MFAKPRNHVRFSLHLAGLKWFAIVAATLLLGSVSIQAQVTPQPVNEVRTLYPSKSGIQYPAALSYSATLNRFYALLLPGVEAASGSRSTVVAFTPYDELVDTTHLTVNLGDSVELAFDDVNRRLFLLNSSSMLLVQLGVGDNGLLDPTTEISTDISGGV